MTATAKQPCTWLAEVVALCVLLAMVSELPHLTDDAWQDEAATLMLFAAHSLGRAFSDYSMPNNHMLFSTILSLWRARGDSVLHARLLLELVWLVSTVLLLAIGRRSRS